MLADAEGAVFVAQIREAAYTCHVEYIGVIAELAHGFELGRYPDGRPYTVVTDRLAPKRPGFIAQEVAFLKTITKKRIKATGTGKLKHGTCGKRHLNAHMSGKKIRQLRRKGVTTGAIVKKYLIAMGEY